MRPANPRPPASAAAWRQLPDRRRPSAGVGPLLDPRAPASSDLHVPPASDHLALLVPVPTGSVT